MNEQVRNLVTLLIAVWGAVTGSISLLLAALRYLKDRVKLSVMPRFSFSFSGLKLPPAATLEVQVVNAGRRPTTLTALLGEKRGLRLRPGAQVRGMRGRFYLKWDLATALEEGKVVTIRVGAKDLPSDCGFRDLGRVVAKDHRGRLWKSRRSFGQQRCRDYENAIEVESDTITGASSDRAVRIRLYQIGSRFWLRWSWGEGNKTSFAGRWIRKRGEALQTLEGIRSSASRYVDGEEVDVRPAEPA